ncbi:MAG: CHAD domain-containing protein [bacterium]|nr:CHAD domain-containing protein [bacterium]
MKTLKKYLRNREVAINFILEKPRAKYSTSTFHKLRVEIKKLNALFNLINYCSKDFRRKKTFKPFKEIFLQAGKVREFQLEEMMLNKHHSIKFLTDYRNSLKKLRLQEQEIFFTIINKDFVARLQKKYKIIIPLLYKINKKLANSYIEIKRTSIQKLLSKSSIKTQDVHELRKQIKLLNFNRKSLSLKEKNKPITNQDLLPNLLGKWHDYQVIIKHLNKTMDTGNLDSKEISQITKLKTKISSNSELLFNKIKLVIPLSEFYKKKKTAKSFQY